MVATLINKLEKIARKNEDKFRYNIGILPTPAGMQYCFTCSEKTDGHEFVVGFGSSPDAAAADAVNNVKEACKEWGYTE